MKKLVQIGNTLKAVGFFLLCVALSEKIELMVAIPMILYGLGTMLINAGMTKIQNDIEEKRR